MTASKMTVEALERIMSNGVRPHAPELAVIGFSGGVAVVLFEPGEAVKQLARTIGWDGARAIFKLSEEGRKALLESTAAADPRLPKWLGRKLDPANPVARILLLTGSDTLLVNYAAYKGWYLEPEAAKAAVN